MKILDIKTKTYQSENCYKKIHINEGKDNRVGRHRYYFTVGWHFFILIQINLIRGW